MLIECYFKANQNYQLQAMKLWQPSGQLYILDHTIIADHKELQQLNSCKELRSKLEHWILKLAKKGLTKMPTAEYDE